MADEQQPNSRDPHPGDVYSQRHKNLSSLRAKHPQQFPLEDWCYFWPNGWDWLVGGASASLAATAPEESWDQIKEKYGQLRLYRTSTLRLDIRTPDGLLSGFADRIDRSPKIIELDNRLRRLETASKTTCMACGGKHGPGRQVEHSGWIHVACQACESLIRDFRNHPEERGP